MARSARKRRQGRTLLVFLTTLAVLLASAALIAYMPQFRLKKVDVFGDTSLPIEDILPVVEPAPDQFFLIGLGGSVEEWFSLRYPVLEAEMMERFPILESVIVRFAWPSTLRVEVIDKAEVVSARVPQGFALLDTKGTVISIREAPSAFLPVTDGFLISGDVEVGKPLPVDPKQFDQAVRLTAAMIGADAAVPYEVKLMQVAVQLFLQDGSYRLDLILPQNQRVRVLVEDNSQLADNLITLLLLIREGALTGRGDGELVLGYGGNVVFNGD
jgi:cell division septal protein FtsQ